MKTLPLIALIITALSLCACSSQDRESTATRTATPPVGSCHETALTQWDLNHCAIQTAEAARNKLNALVNELRNHMETVQYQRLANIQSEWERVANEHCQWEADFFAGGSSQPMWLAGCLEEQYLQRISALRFNLCEGYGATGDCAAASKYK